MKTHFTKIISTLLFCWSGWVASASGAEIDAIDVKITQLYIYPAYNNGEVQVMVNSAPSACSAGFWLSPADPGYAMTLGFLMNAYSNANNVHLVGESSELWGGSSTPHCRLIAVGLK